MKPNSKMSRGLVWVVLLVGFTFWGSMGCKPQKHELPPPPPTPTPIIPPGSIVFVQRGHLARLDLESSQTIPLTSGKSTEWFPACSPKGDQVAYWSNAEGEIYNLWKINMDGSSRVQLTFDEANGMTSSEQNLLINNSPAWSSDGKKIIYSLEGDIWEMDSDGFNPETLLSGKKALCPSFSPDGKSIMYLSMGEDQVYNLWSMGLSDLVIKKLTNYTDWNVGSPSFSMDGRKIIFNLYRENETQIYTALPDGSNPLNLTTNNRCLCPRFAQNDRKIVFCSYGAGEDVGLTLSLAGVNATDIKALPPDNADSPSWAPAPLVAATTPATVSSQPASQAAMPVKPVSQISLPTPVGK